MSSSSESTTDNTHQRSHARCGGRRRCGSNWSGFNIASMVVGFLLWWPVGLFILLWAMSGRDVAALPESVRRLWSNLTNAWQGPVASATRSGSDNAVFDEYQQAQWERVREIKDEIRDRARRFGDFRAKAKRRADEQEFNDFMSDAPLRGER